MQITRVICRKPVPLSDKMAAAGIMLSIDANKMRALLKEKNRTIQDDLWLARAMLEYDKAVKLFGFSTIDDFVYFTNIYGMKSIME